MSASVERVFLEALDDLQSGRAQDVDHYLERVPMTEREQLADLLAMYFASRRGPRHAEVSRTAYTRVLATLDRMTDTAGRAGTLPGLLAELRRTRGLRRSDVTRAICDLLGLSDQAIVQLEREYHRLETGQLDGRRLSRRILEALAEIFRIPVDDLAEASLPLRSEPQRATRSFARSAGAFTVAARAAPPDRDETTGDVRALFYGGRDA